MTGMSDAEAVDVAVQRAVTIPEATTRGKHAQPGGARDVEALLDQLDGRLAAESSWPDVAVPDGYAVNAKRHMIPGELVRDADSLENDVVRRILAFGLDLANQIARFRAHTFDDLATFLDLLGEQYGRRRTAGKGGYSCTSYDGRLKVQVQVQDRITFGPELQVARELVNACLIDWAEDAQPEARAIIQDAFAVDKHGSVNREAVFRMRRLQIDDERWKRAQQAVSDSIRTEGAKAHVRLYMRPTPEASWTLVPINIASGWMDQACAGAAAEPPKETSS